MPRRARTTARRRILRLVAVSVLAVAAAGSEYRGCGGAGAPDSGTALPETTGGCLVDADCVSEDMCVALVCRAGTCVESGVAVDADADGYAPAPCGMDCDDRDPDIRPGAAERCDGVDEDCDGIVDEGATGVRTLNGPAEVVNAKIVGLGDEYVVLGLVVEGDPSNTLAAYSVGRDGSASLPQRVGSALAPLAFDVARDGDALAVAMITGADATPARVSLSRAGGDAWIAAEPPTPIGTQTDAERIVTTVFAGQQWVAFDARRFGALERHLWRSGDPASVIPIGPVADDESPPALADDGANLWVSRGDATLSAFDAEGAEVGARDLPGRVGHGALASGDGFVYALYRDAFDHVMTRVTTESFTTPIAAPSGNETDRVSIYRTGSDVLVTRSDAAGVTAWLLEDDLRSYRGTFDASQLGSPGFGPGRVTAAATDGGVPAVLSSHSDGVTPPGIAILACESP